MRWLVLTPLLLGCVTFPPRPAMPQPEELQMCIDGPLGIEFCPTIKLRWESDEERLERMLHEQRLEEHRQEMERLREEWKFRPEKQRAARVLV